MTPLDGQFLRDYAETRGFMLGRPVKAKPTPDGKSVLFLRAQPRVAKLRLYEFDVATRATRELLSPEALLKGAAENLSPEEKARRERQRISVGGFTDYQLSEDGRKRFFQTYEQRKATVVTHPVFGYKMSYGRMLEVQARMLAAFVRGDIPSYTGFTVR